MSTPSPLSADQVRHVARLARLELAEADVERYRAQLASIIAYVAQISELDVEAVEPLTHPGIAPRAANRLDHDEPQPSLPIAALTMNAPAMEGRLLAVPKVIGDAGEGG